MTMINLERSLLPLLLLSFLSSSSGLNYAQSDGSSLGPHTVTRNSWENNARMAIVPGVA